MEVKRRGILFISIVLLLLAAALVMQSFSEGSIGMRPMTHGCWGIRVQRHDTILVFPKAELEFYWPFHFRYSVSEQNKDRLPFCLGKDIWMGE